MFSTRVHINDTMCINEIIRYQPHYCGLRIYKWFSSYIHNVNSMILYTNWLSCVLITCTASCDNDINFVVMVMAYMLPITYYPLVCPKLNANIDVLY